MAAPIEQVCLLWSNIASSFFNIAIYRSQTVDSNLSECKGCLQVNDTLKSKFCKGCDHPHHAQLRYLGFVEETLNLATVCVVRIYYVAKEWSGKWRPRINEVEKKLKDLVGPFYHLLEGKQHEILLFIDHKVDVIACAVRKHTSHKVNELSDGAIEVAKKVPDFLLEVAGEVHRVGLVETSKAYFTKYEPLAEECTLVAWKQFLKLPYSVKAVHLFSPPALFIGEKFNQVLSSLKEKHLPLIDYVPLLPMKRIETIIKKEN